MTSGDVLLCPSEAERFAGAKVPQTLRELGNSVLILVVNV